MKRILARIISVVFVLNIVLSMSIFGADNSSRIKNNLKDAQTVTQKGHSTSNGNESDNNGYKENANDGKGENPINWELSWSDEFEGTEIDRTKWTYDIGNWIIDGNGDPIVKGWGNNELEYYTDSSDNSYVEDGKLIIKALEEETTDHLGSYDYTSAKLKTKNLFSQKYGRFEISAKLPLGQGLWPAFWMLPEDDVYGGWAASGEIDIMEAWGSKPTLMSGAIHYGGLSPKNTFSGGQTTLEDDGTINEFHEYAIEWLPGKITWFVDDVPYHTESSWYSVDENGENYAFPAPFDQEFYMVMNLAVGGWFDGDPDENTEFPAQMEVDYVRVYESKNDKYGDVYISDVELETLPDGAKLPTADGNYISNGGFTEPIQNNVDASLPFEYYWNFVHVSDFGGSGSQSIVEVDGQNYAQVDITSGGNQNYAVQLIQETTLGTGRYYKVSFDAKSTGNRSMNMKMGGGPDRGYAVYSSSYDIQLSEEWTHFEEVFLMQADTDIKARLEMNLGLDTKSVWIGNVRVEEISEYSFDYDAPKEPLPDGNGIYNGEFDKESVDRLAYWNIEYNKAIVFYGVGEARRELFMDIKNPGKDIEDVTLNQKGIEFKANTDYRLIFDAKSDRAKNIKLTMMDELSDLIYLSSEMISMTKDMTTYQFDFSVGEVGTSNGIVEFLLGENKGDFHIDNIVLIATSVDYTDIDTHPLKNGDFSSNKDSWGEYIDWSANASISVDNEEAVINILNVGPQSWGILMEQGPFDMSNKVDYIIAFDAKSTVDRNIEVTIENAGYYRYLSEKVSLSSEFTHYEFVLDMPVEDFASLKFLVGNTDETIDGDIAHTIVLDNVVFQVIGAPQPPEEPEPPVDPNGPIVTNGTFDTDTSGWTTYVGDGSNAEISSVNGQLEVLFPAYAGWFLWSTQVYQDNISLEAGKTYELSFDISSTVDKDILVQMTDMEEKALSLTSTMETVTFEFTATTDTTSGKLNFLLGTNNMDGADFIVNQKVLIDNILISEQVEPPVEGPIVTNGTFDTDTSGWTTYVGDGSNAEISSVNGQLEVLFPAYAGWFLWSTQVYQDNISLEAGKTYELSFDISSTVDKDILVQMTDMEEKALSLTSTMETVTYEFTATADTTTGVLNFLLGTNNMDGGDFVVNQKVVIDNIQINE